jgi:hypothetical protein
LTEKYGNCEYYVGTTQYVGKSVWGAGAANQDSWTNLISGDNVNMPGVALGSINFPTGNAMNNKFTKSGTNYFYQDGTAAMFQVQPDYQLSCDYTRASSPHTAGINVALGDGSVRFVAGGINSATWWLSLVPNDGNALPSDW